MRSVAVCPVCIERRVAKGDKSIPTPLSGELDDCGFIHVTCDDNHYGIVVYDARRYEILVQSAARAYVDGYTNEVIAVMSAALERAYEFYVRVSCRAKDIAKEAVESAWKTVASQSERQFGAFQFLYLIDQGAAFKLEPSITETRNNVIHRGKIAREAEATEFAEKVFARIREIEQAIQKRFAKESLEEAAQEVERQVSLVPSGVAHIKLKKTTVRVDKEKNEVVGLANCFLDVALAIHQGRERGFPS
jgi:hypothetical protein